MTESELRSRFEDLTLSPDAFSHEEHVRLAWTYLHEHALLDVLRIFPENLRRYAASVGASAIYNETVTWAFLLLINERVDPAREESWEGFVARNGDLLMKSILERYYDTETLASEPAKRLFLFPRPSA